MGNPQTIAKYENLVQEDEKKLYVDGLNAALGVVKKLGAQGDQLNHNLIEILEEPITLKDKNNKEYVMQGPKNDPDGKTYGRLDIFAGEEFMGHPFNEASRCMDVHFKMYCLVNGISDQEMLSLVNKKPSGELLNRFRNLKKDFLQMILNKDMKAIADFYVGLAKYSEHKIPSLLQCGDLRRLPANANKILLMHGAASYLAQTLCLGNSKGNISEDQEKLITEVNKRLKESGKDYTLEALYDTLYPTLYVGEAMLGKTGFTVRQTLTYEELNVEEFMVPEMHDSTKNVVFKLLALTKINNDQKNAARKQGKDPHDCILKIGTGKLMTDTETGYISQPCNQLLADNIKTMQSQPADPAWLLKQLRDNVIHGFFGKQDDPEEFKKLLTAVEAAMEEEQSINSLPRILMTTIGRCERIYQNVLETAESYLRTFEPGKGDTAKRYKLVILARNMARDRIHMLHENPRFNAYSRHWKNAAGMLEEGDVSCKLRENLNKAFNVILEERFAYTGSDNRQHIIEGKKANPDAGTFGIQDVFEQEEYKGKPFSEVSKTMSEHFKMYCLTKGMTEEEMLKIAQTGNIPKERMEQFRAWKQEFMNMILQKDMNAISDMYVKIALEVDADKNRFAALKPGAPLAMRNDRALILKYAGAQSWYRLSIEHERNSAHPEGRELVAMINRKLKAAQKDYTYDHLHLPVLAADALSLDHIPREMTGQTLDYIYNEGGDLNYQNLHAYTAILQDYMHAPEAHQEEQSWLSAMPETIREIIAGIDDYAGTKLDARFEDQEYYASLPEIAPIPKKRALEELQIKYTKMAKNWEADRKYDFDHQNPAKDKKANAPGADQYNYEQYPQLKEIETLAGGQIHYLEIFAKSEIPYPAEQILANLKNESLRGLHDQAKASFKNSAEVRQRLRKQFRFKDARFARIGYLFLDPADTPEAFANNQKFVEEVNTPDGSEALANRIAKYLMETDIQELYAANAEEMAKKYLENPAKYEMLAAAIDLVKTGEGTLSKIQEPLFSAVTEKISMLQKGINFRYAARLMSLEGWAAFINENLTMNQVNTLVPRILNILPNLFVGESPAATELNELWGIMAHLTNHLTEREIVGKMAAKDLMKDHQTLALYGKAYTRADALEEVKKNPLMMNEIGIIPPTPETKKELTRLLREMPLSVKDINEFNAYKPIIEFHRKALTANKMPVPSPYELREHMDPKGMEVHEKAKVFVVKRAKERDKLNKLYHFNTHQSLERICRFMLDTSGTPEAVERNKALLESSATVEGQKKLANYLVKEFMSLPEEFFLANNIYDAARKYMANPAIYELAFAAKELINYKDKNSPLQIVDPLRAAFIQKVSWLEAAGSVMKHAAGLMARDDWGILSHLELNENTAVTLGGTYNSRKDPYLPQGTDASLFTILGVQGTVMQPLFRAAGLTDVQKAGLFSNGAEITFKGKASAFDREVMTHFGENGLDGLSFRVNEAKNESIKEQLKALDTNFRAEAIPVDTLNRRDSRVKKTTGASLRNDMLESYQVLDGVNHGAFVSSGEFDKVLKAVYDLGHNQYRAEEEEEKLNQIIDYANVYIKIKNKLELDHKLKQRGFDRRKAVIDVRNKCKAILNVIDDRHKKAELMHEASRSRFAPDNAVMKSNEELYDEETARMSEGDTEEGRLRRAREIFAKFRATPVQLHELAEDGVTYIPPMPVDYILERMQDDKIKTLRKNAVDTVNTNYRYTSGQDKTISFGNGLSDMNRLAGLFMDISDTEEAKEHNRLVRAAMTTEAGCKQLFAHMVYRLMTSDVLNKLMCATTLEEFIALYKEDPQVCEFAFLTQELDSYVSTLEEPLKTAYKDRVQAFQQANMATVAMRYVASDAYLAYPDMKLGVENADQWNQRSTILSTVAPKEKIYAAISNLGLDIGSAQAFKTMYKKKLLDTNVYFVDENGKHLTLAKAAEKVVKGEKVQSKKLNDDLTETLEEQLKKLDVPDPLDVGRQVLEGKMNGVNGPVTQNNYREQFIGMLNEMKDLKKEYPDQKSDQMEQAMKLLEKAAKEMPADNKGLQEACKSLSNTLHQLWEQAPSHNPFQERSRSKLSLLSNRAEELYNLAHSVAEYQAHKEKMAKEHDNGAAAFAAAYLTPESVGPKELKDIARAGLEMLENCEGMNPKKLQVEKQRMIADGVAAMYLLTRMKVEVHQNVSQKAGSVTRLLTEHPETAKGVCEYLRSASKEIVNSAKSMLGSREKMKETLSDPSMMAWTLGYCMQEKGINLKEKVADLEQDIRRINEARELVERRRQAEKQGKEGKQKLAENPVK